MINTRVEVNSLKLTGMAQCVSIRIQLGHTNFVCEWLRGETPQRVDMVSLVAKTYFLDSHEAYDALLIYKRLLPSQVAQTVPDESKAAQLFFAEHTDTTQLRFYEMLYDVDRIDDLAGSDLTRAQQCNAYGHLITGEAQCLRVRINPGQTSNVRDYFARLKQRDDVAEVLRNEVVLIESVFLDAAPDGDYILFYTRAQNLKKSGEAFKRSTHPVDVEARAFMAEAWDMLSAAKLEMIFDVDRIAELTSR